VIAFRNLLRAPVRSLLSALGVGAGIALFVAIAAITVDVRRQIVGAVNAYNVEVVAYERRATSPFSSRISPAQMQELQARYGSSLAPLVMGTRNEPWNAYVLVLGVPADLVKRIPLTAGEPYAEGTGAVMLGEIAARQLGRAPAMVLQLDGRDAPITGVFRTGSRLLDGGIMTDIAHAQRLLAREGAEGQYSLALLRADNGQAAEALMTDINRRYPWLKAMPGTEFAGALRLLRVVDAFVRTIAVLVLMGTALVTTNTLLMALAERTREIGILMAVGWTPWTVLRMLLIESVALCAAGAALGNGLALVLLRVVNKLDAIGFGWTPVTVPPSVAGFSLLVALSVSVLALVWPAAVLSRVQPLTALRHE
jgi:putative ABC transport system permease protein